MKLEINKIITLGNNEEYLVVDKVEKDDNIYLDEVLGEDQLKSILPLFVKE